MKKADQEGRTKLLFFVKDNYQDFEGMKRETVAKVCSEALGYDFRKNHICGVRERLTMVNAPLWKESRTWPNKKGASSDSKEKDKWKKSVEKQFEEQDKKFAILFAKIHALTNYPPPNNLTPEAVKFFESQPITEN